MSDLREQLQAARQEYLQERYSGNLAADILSRRTWHWGRWTAAASAIAAVLIVAVYVYQQMGEWQPPDQIVVVPPNETPAIEEQIEVSLGAVPVMRMGDVSVEFVPPACDFSFGVPNFSLSSDETTDQTSPAEEAV